MTDHPIPMSPPPIAVYLPPPAADVTDGVTALRVACAKWAPTPGTSEHQAEVHVCKVLLDRDQAFSLGVTLGRAVAVLVGAFWLACRSAVRAQTVSKYEEAAALVLCALLSLPIGLIADFAVVQFRPHWSDALQDLAVAAALADAIGSAEGGGMSDNQAMAHRLAAAVGEHPGASPSSAIMAAGLFAIAGSIDRLTWLLERECRAERAKGRAAAKAGRRG